jgi:hypothetical protein
MEGWWKCVHEVAGDVEKNPQIFDIYQYLSVLNGDDIDPPEDIAPEKFSVKSGDLERASSAYKHILSDKRQSMTPENMEMILICIVHQKINDCAKRL